MYPLDVTHVVLRRWRAGVWGTQRVWNLPPREGGLHVRLSHRILHHTMAKQLPLS